MRLKRPSIEGMEVRKTLERDDQRYVEKEDIYMMLLGWASVDVSFKIAIILSSMNTYVSLLFIHKPIRRWADERLRTNCSLQKQAPKTQGRLRCNMFHAEPLSVISNDLIGRGTGRF